MINIRHCLVVGLSLIAILARADVVSPEEMAQKKAWVAANLAPFSFTYGGWPSSQLLSSWPHKEKQRRLDADRTEHSVT
jgi:hypothetical protein